MRTARMKFSGGTIPLMAEGPNLKYPVNSRYCTCRHALRETLAPFRKEPLEPHELGQDGDSKGDTGEPEHLRPCPGLY